jgi:FKBP-type peptidyl-prolyl cis-trans isomerase FkpA
MSVTAVPIRPLRKGSIAKLWIGVALLSAAAAAAAWKTTAALHFEQTASGAEYQVVENGEGPSPGANDIAKIHVTIRERGRIVQNSRDGEPPEVPIGQLPPSLSEVLQQMNKGSTYLVRLSPEQMGAPPGAARPGAPKLTVELTLVEFRTLNAEEQRQMEMMRMLQQQMQQGGGPGGPQGTPGAAPQPEPAPAPPPQSR